MRDTAPHIPTRFARVLVAVLLILTILTPVAIGANIDDDHQELAEQRPGEPPMLQPGADIDPVEYYNLWNAIPSDVIDYHTTRLADMSRNTTRTDDEQYIVNSTQIMVLFSKFVERYNTYPTVVAEWNDHTLRSYEPGDRNTSRYPEDANLRDGRWIEDAWVDIVSTTPTTRKHVEPGDTVTLTTPDGDTRYATDYSFDVPDDQTSDTSKTLYSLENHEINKTQYIIDGDVEHTRTANQHTGSFSYDALSNGDHSLTVETTITVSVHITEKDKKYRCVVYNETSDECERTESYWDTTRDETVVDTVTVSNTQHVTTTSITTTPKITYREHPSGYTHVHVTDVPDQWSTLRFQDNVTVLSQHIMYSQRDPAWDTVNTQTGRNVTKVHPAQVHAAPMERGVSIPNNNAKIIDTNGPTNQAPTNYPDPVQNKLLVANNTYEKTDTITFRTRNNVFTQSSQHVTVTDFTDDTATVTAERSGYINETNLNLTVVQHSRDQNTTKLRVTLTDTETGDPINTQQRQNHNITINDEHVVETNANGVAETTLPYINTGYVTASFNPPQSFRYDTVYTPSSDGEQLPVSFQSPIEYFEVAFQLLLVLGPLAWIVWVTWKAVKPLTH